MDKTYLIEETKVLKRQVKKNWDIIGESEAITNVKILLNALHLQMQEC